MILGNSNKTFGPNGPPRLKAGGVTPQLGNPSSLGFVRDHRTSVIIPTMRADMMRQPVFVTLRARHPLWGGQLPRRTPLMGPRARHFPFRYCHALSLLPLHSLLDSGFHAFNASQRESADCWHAQEV